MPKMRLGRRYKFSAIHSIPQEDFIHGHNYELEIQLSGPLQESGWITSREIIDELVQTHFLSQFDRKWINETVLPATGENLAQYAYKVISEALPDHLKLEEIELHETRKNSFRIISQ